MSVRAIANKLSKQQRDFLIDHIDGPHPISQGYETFVRNALEARGLVCFDLPQSLRPKTTIITELGREIVCAILGDYADALVRSGVIEKAPPIELEWSPPLQETNLAREWVSSLTDH